MIHPDLLRAFQSTKFIVCGPQTEIVMRVGERCSELDQLLMASDATSCAFITAWNPGSVRVFETANRVKQNQLIQEVQNRGYAFLHGRGVGEGSGWAPEPSILIIGIARQTAKELGRLFGQIAIVFVEQGKSVELLLCPE
jgi:Protein of unknown function (DUF3293)